MKKLVLVLVAVACLSLLLAGTAAASGKGQDKVTICHKPGTPAQKTMLVPGAAVPGHLGHGDHLGPCTGEPPAPPPEPPEGAEKVTLCHKPGTPAQKTMQVPEDAVPDHLGHGDYLGPCTGEPPAPPPEPPEGAEKVTLCHKPGTPAQKTMQVPEDAVPDHLGHGDYLGPCTGEPPLAKTWPVPACCRHPVPI